MFGWANVIVVGGSKPEPLNPSFLKAFGGDHVLFNQINDEVVVAQGDAVNLVGGSEDSTRLDIPPIALCQAKVC